MSVTTAAIIYGTVVTFTFFLATLRCAYLSSALARLQRDLHYASTEIDSLRKMDGDARARYNALKVIAAYDGINDDAIHMSVAARQALGWSDYQ